MTEEEQRTICQICGKVFQHLGSHVAKRHKMTAREYKEEFGLDYKFSLISREVLEKKREAFEEDREKYLKNLFKHGKKYWFKKGQSRKPILRVSKQSRKRHLAQLKAIEGNARGKCYVCGAVFDHLSSHLYNKHGLVKYKGKQGRG